MLSLIEIPTFFDRITIFSLLGRKILFFISSTKKKTYLTLYSRHSPIFCTLFMEFVQFFFLMLAFRSDFNLLFNNKKILIAFTDVRIVQTKNHKNHIIQFMDIERVSWRYVQKWISWTGKLQHVTFYTKVHTDVHLKTIDII